MILLIALIFPSVPVFAGGIANSANYGFDALANSNGLLGFGSNIKQAGIGGLIKGVGDALSLGLGAVFNPTQAISNSILGMFQNSSLADMLDNVLAGILDYFGAALESLSNMIFDKVFGLLCVYIDFTSVPSIKADVSNFYNAIKKLSLLIIGVIFLASLLSLLLAGFASENMAKFGRDIAVLAGGVIAAVLLMTYLPNLLTTSSTLMSSICDSIVSFKIKGEDIKYVKGSDIVDQSSNPIDNLTGTISNKFDQSVNNAIDNTKQNIKDTLVNPVQQKLNDVINNPINSITKAIDKKVPIVGAITQNNKQVEMRNQAGIAILKIIISVVSLGLALSLLALKAIQLVSILLFFFLAPLVVIFLIFPQGHNLVAKFFSSFLGLLAYPIVWAVMIKVYFFLKLSLNISSDIGLSSSTITDVKLLTVFMELALLTLALGVSGIVGYVFATANIANAKSMAGMITAFPAMVGGFVGGAAGAAATGLETAAMFSHFASTQAGNIGKAAASKLGFGSSNANSNLVASASNINEMAQSSLNKLGNGGQPPEANYFW